MGSCCSSNRIKPDDKNSGNPHVDSILINSNLNEKSPEKLKILADKNNNADQNKYSHSNQLTFVNVPTIKTKNYNNYHKNLNGETVIKKSCDTNGQQIIFDSCKNSTFIIIDAIAQVTIEKCQDCSFFIGPCKSNISLRNSNNVCMISCSQQLLCRNLENSKLSIFVMTHPTFEDCNNIEIACYCFDNFIQFKGLFDSSELCLWENKWSEYNVFSVNSSVTLREGSIIQDDSFKNILDKFNELSLNKYDYHCIPFTYGLSYDYYNQQNILFFLDTNKITEEIFSFFDKDNLEKKSCSLIKTCLLDKNENSNVIDDIVSNLKNEVFEKLIKGKFDNKIWIRKS